MEAELRRESPQVNSPSPRRDRSRRPPLGRVRRRPRRKAGRAPGCSRGGGGGPCASPQPAPARAARPLPGAAAERPRPRRGPRAPGPSAPPCTTSWSRPRTWRRRCWPGRSCGADPARRAGRQGGARWPRCCCSSSWSCRLTAWSPSAPCLSPSCWSPWSSLKNLQVRPEASGGKGRAPGVSWLTQLPRASLLGAPQGAGAPRLPAEPV